ncbi:hypothetical protein [Paraburkholderia sp. WSM4175]|uniref:hypothetical protein n=1 Tax=Paraburkholderia sp. WSM4175 TaxID=2991072 RepID=UPI003D2130D2
MQEVDRGWKLSYEERQKARKEREEQIEQDERDFDRLFRVSTSRRDARGCSDFSTYAAFISEHLSISCLGAPVDGEGVTRILRDAVRDGRLVPAIDRAWRGSRRVARPYGPQSWPKRVPDPKPTVYGFLDGQLVPFGADGCLIERTLSASSSSSSRFDLLGAVGAMAGAAIGGAGFAVNGGNGAGAIANSTLLGDAKPFEYVPEALSGDAVELAASTNNPNYAAKMLGYDRKTFGDMVHAMKFDLKLRGDDNVIWHDTGAVEFRKNIIGNMHDYTN